VKDTNEIKEKRGRFLNARKPVIVMLAVGLVIAAVLTSIPYTLTLLSEAVTPEREEVRA
jgi:hypothetical protein